MGWTKQDLIELFRRTARKYGIDERIAIAQINQESGFSLNKCSHKGACGIAQFMPGTAARWGVNVKDPVSSAEGWGKYMSWLLRQPYINGNYALALAGYNAGEGRIQQYGTIPPFKETQEYVKIILSNAGKNISEFVDNIWNVQTAPFAENGTGFLSSFFSRSSDPKTYTPVEVTKDERRKVILFIAAILIIIVIAAYVV